MTRAVVIDRSLPAFCPVCEGSGKVRLLPVLTTDGKQHRGEGPPQSVVHDDRRHPVTNACLHCGPAHVPVVLIGGAG